MGLTSKAKKGYIKSAILMTAALALITLRINVVDLVTVSGSSMEPTYSSGDNLLSLHKKKFQRYDVVIVHSQDRYVIKRLVGLPGDTLLITDGHLYINGERAADEYDFETDYAGVASEEITLGEDEYFIMGDNRQNSYDSRYYGAVSAEDIVGVVI